MAISRLHGGLWSILSLHVIVLACAVHSAAPSDKPAVKLGEPIEVSVDEMAAAHAVLLGDSESIAIVGTTNLRDDAYPEKSPPSGAIVNLRTKKVQRFTNGHTTGIYNVVGTADGSRIVTAGAFHEGLIRVWDFKAGKQADPIRIPPVDDTSNMLDIGRFHRSNRIAAALPDRVSIFDLAGREERLDLTADYLSNSYPNMPTVSPDDKSLACHTHYSQVLVWDIGTKKVLFAASLLPVGAERYDWSISDTAFLKSGTQLIVARGSAAPGNEEVPKDTAETKVPAEKRGLWLIDVAKQKTIPLGMGHTRRIQSMALHPSDEWIATIGDSWADKPKIAGESHGELRIWGSSVKSVLLVSQKEEHAVS